MTQLPPTSQLVLALLGPTASGKTAFSIEIAKALDAEIIALDSTTPYRQFNIGSSKPSPSEQKQVRHHLIDLLEPGDPFSAFDFVKKADEAIQDITARKKVPLIVGGTYFYLRSLQNGMFAIPPVDPAVVETLENEFEEQDQPLVKMHEMLTQLDPKTAEHIHPNDRYRMIRALSIIRATGKRPSELPLVRPAGTESTPRLWVKYALLVPRHELTQRITFRTDQMLNQGLIEETKRLLETFPDARALTSIGYAECVRYLKQEIDHKQLRNEVIEKTRQLAKRQMTWLRSDPEVRFIDARDRERILLEVNNLQWILKGERNSL